MNSTESSVFLLWHSRPATSDTDPGNDKLIGVFATEKRAAEVATQLRSAPGFRSFPDSFTIDPYTVDKVNWEDGFVWDDE